MKRSYSDMLPTDLLPSFATSDQGKFKSTLEGTYKLRVIKSVDISKPIEKPIDEIEEPEDEETATENKLNQNSARMLQLHLRDTNGTEINAVEVERVESLSALKPHWKVIISGPVEIRCGNIMLEKKHILNIEPPTGEEIQQIKSETQSGQSSLAPTIRSETQSGQSSLAPTIRSETQSGQSSLAPTIKSEPTTIQLNPIQPSTLPQVVHIVEDWDEEDEDDCIILD